MKPIQLVTLVVLGLTTQAFAQHEHAAEAKKGCCVVVTETKTVYEPPAKTSLLPKDKDPGLRAYRKVQKKVQTMRCNGHKSEAKTSCCGK